jgi:hypothetical protein
VSVGTASPLAGVSPTGVESAISSFRKGRHPYEDQFLQTVLSIIYRTVRPPSPGLTACTMVAECWVTIACIVQKVILHYD